MLFFFYPGSNANYHREDPEQLRQDYLDSTLCGALWGDDEPLPHEQEQLPSPLGMRPSTLIVGTLLGGVLWYGIWKLFLFTWWW